jgi:spermidine synthase
VETQPSTEEILDETQPQSRSFLYFLTLTALVCGALVMVIEVLGSRVIGPLFGVSLFVWTALITVTLVALAGGYALGGVLADRRGTPGRLYALILAAGLLVLLVPLLKAPVLKACVPLGLRAGALVAATVLFGPALMLLGCVSPWVIRLAAREVRSLGRTVGVFYAISTAGSFLGTIGTGFVLVALFTVRQIFFGVGLALVALAVAYFVAFRRRAVAAAALLVALGPLLTATPGPISKLMPSGTRATVVYARDGQYGNVKVVEYSFGPIHTREMMIDGLIQGGIDVATGQSIYEYSYFLELLPYALNPRGRRCLVVGLGAGIVPMWYEQRGVRCDVVDIDPEVVAVARRYFGFQVAGDTILEDARYFLNATPRTYDYVILDVFNGDITPSHVLSREALAVVRARLAPGGVAAVNLIGSLRRDTFMTASVIRTLREVFAQVEVFPTFDPAGADAYGNLALVAYDGPHRALDLTPVAGLPVHPLAKDVRPLLGRTFAFPPGTPAVVLTDDFNPLDVHDTWLREQVRRTIIATTDWDVLLR